MVDVDSDPQGGEPDSPLSSSSSGPIKSVAPHSPTKAKSIDRLYSAASSHRHVIPESEHSPLLHHLDGIRSYFSTPVHEAPDPFDSLTSSPRPPLGLLTRKISRVFQSKAYDYDSNKHSLAAVGSGERVW
jgi:hypothetical protein